MLKAVLLIFISLQLYNMAGGRGGKRDGCGRHRVVNEDGETSKQRIDRAYRWANKISMGE
jgi:hypothetical protein